MNANSITDEISDLSSDIAQMANAIQANLSGTTRDILNSEA